MQDLAMLVQLKVRKIGNSLGLLLPKEALAQLKAQDGTAFYLSSAPEGGFRLSPFDPEFAKQMELAQEGMRRYRNTLRELAK
jgi:putative addiction module antidote